MVNFLKSKNAIETLYDGVCTIHIMQKTKDPETGGIDFDEAILISDAPCRLSFSTFPTTDIVTNAPGLGQAAKLFISPELDIPPGSKIVVTQHGSTTVYSNSGQPAKYATHQEINLELFKVWA